MRRNTISQFIESIWDIVSDGVSDEIISWNPHGTSFSIHDTQLFSSEIIPKHFNHANLSSFIRQLNMYNFHKKKTEKGRLQFHHKLFRRGAKQLLVGIKRKPSESDAKEGQELLRAYLQRLDPKNEQKSMTSIDDRKSQSNHIGLEIDDQKIGLDGDEKGGKFEAKIIKNVIFYGISDNLNSTNLLTSLDTVMTYLIRQFSL